MADPVTAVTELVVELGVEVIKVVADMEIPPHPGDGQIRYLCKYFSSPYFVFSVVSTLILFLSGFDDICTT